MTITLFSGSFTTRGDVLHLVSLADYSGTTCFGWLSLKTMMMVLAACNDEDHRWVLRSVKDGVRVVVWGWLVVHVYVHVGWGGRRGLG
jgi:hypothetical protein